MVAEVMSKQIIKVFCVTIICLIFITSFCLPSFAGRAPDISTIQISDNVYDFDLDTAISSLSDFDVNQWNNVAYVGYLNSALNSPSSFAPQLTVIYYNLSFSSSSYVPVPIGQDTFFLQFLAASYANWGQYPIGYVSLKNVSGSTVYLTYYSFTFRVAGNVSSTKKSTSVIPVSDSSSSIISPDFGYTNYGGTGDLSTTFSTNYFNIPSNSPCYTWFMPVTFVGFGNNGVGVSSGLSPNIPVSGLGNGQTRNFNVKINDYAYGSVDSSQYADISTLTNAPEKIAFNFKINGSIVRGSDNESSCPSLTGSPVDPNPPFGGSTSGSASGTASGSYDSSTGDINLDVNLEQDYSPLIDFGDSEDVPSISDSSADEFESAVSDLPSIQDDDLDTVFNNYGFDSNNSAIRWIYSMINTLFNGNQKVFSVLLSFLVLSLLMLILNKRGQ